MLHEVFAAMTRALRTDRLSLHTVMASRVEDLRRALADDPRAQNPYVRRQLETALTASEQALAGLTRRLNAAPAVAPLFAAPDVQETDEVPDDAGDEVDEGEEPEPEPVKVQPNPMVTRAPVLKPAVKPAEERDPVAMPARMRKDIGDLGADMLDDYAKNIEEKVQEFFDTLLKQMLDLGAEDSEDEATSLREQLRTEIGERGLARIEPHFPEWRGHVVKRLLKDVIERFEPTEEQVEMPKDATPVEYEPDEPSEPADAEGEPGTEAETAAAAPKPVNGSGGPARPFDFAPSGAIAATLRIR